MRASKFSTTILNGNEIALKIPTEILLSLCYHRIIYINFEALSASLKTQIVVSAKTCMKKRKDTKYVFVTHSPYLDVTVTSQLAKVKEVKSFTL